MHAGWNAFVKGGTDPFITVTQISLFSGGTALCCMPFVKVPAADVWPWLVASAAIHTLYRFMLIGAYRAGDMAQVYPIMRGAAPMMTALATAFGGVTRLTQMRRSQTHSAGAQRGHGECFSKSFGDFLRGGVFAASDGPPHSRMALLRDPERPRTCSPSSKIRRACDVVGVIVDMPAEDSHS